VTRNAAAWGTYIYNGMEQLVSRVSQSPAAPIGTIHYIYDLDGHLIAEANGSTGAITRVYIWLPANDNRNDTLAENMLGTAANDNATPDLPLAVVDIAGTTQTLLHVHTDHLGRPTRMTNAAKATVWSANYKPWGEVQAITGTATQNLRFPGQYFQIETGLAYNWHRSYDPVTGRYTQPDPLGFVDGPSVYAYAGSSPWMFTDREGLEGEPEGWPENYPKLPLSDETLRPMNEKELRDMKDRLSKGGNTVESDKVKKWQKQQGQRNKKKNRGQPKTKIPGLPWWLWMIPEPSCENYPGDPFLCPPAQQAKYCPSPGNKILPEMSSFLQ
jgi:RHS repeat-associated protein